MMLNEHAQNGLAVVMATLASQMPSEPLAASEAPEPTPSGPRPLGTPAGANGKVHGNPTAVEQRVRSKVYSGLSAGLPNNLDELEDEAQFYVDVMMGREDMPLVHGVTDRYEVATAYLTRLLEIKMLLLNGENHMLAPKGGLLNKFRTGTLEVAIHLMEKQMELASRRISVWLAERSALGA